MTNPFIVGLSYSFSTISTPALPSSLSNVQLLGEMTFELAVAAGSGGQNLTALSAAIYPSLPTTTSNDPTTYTFLVFKMQSGAKTILALEWINISSIELASSMSLHVTVPNINLSDSTTIQSLLTQAGYSGITLNQVSATPPTLIKIIATTQLSNNLTNDLTMTLGSPVNAVAIGLYSDNSVSNITNQVIWSSSAPTIVGVNAISGAMSPLTSGTATVSASASGLASSTINITI